MPVDEPENFVVALSQLDWRNYADTLKAWKAWHPTRLMVTGKMRETIEFAVLGN